MQQLKIYTCLSPLLLPLVDLSDKIVIVIDVFRATSTICMALEMGAKAVIPVPNLEICRSYQNKSEYILGGERNALIPPGLDVGNSPRQFSSINIDNKTLVLSTTNGTKSIVMAQETAKEVITGCFLNIDAVVNYLVEKQSSVLLFCSGRSNVFSLEDSLFAGALAHELSLKGFSTNARDTTLGMQQLYLSVKDDLAGFLQNSIHFQRLAEVGMMEDALFCLQKNHSSIVPILKEGRLLPYS